MTTLKKSLPRNVPALGDPREQTPPVPETPRERRPPMDSSAPQDNASSESCCCGCGGDDRRGFLTKSAALLVAAGSLAVPAVSGALAVLNPLRLKGAGGEFLRLAALDTLPGDGTPRKFPVIAERVDAWTRTVEPIGAVYLRRVGDKVEGLHVVCPHAGCSIETKELTDEQGAKTPGFICPCHKAIFDLSGKRLGTSSASPRDLDQLEVEVRNGSEVWVRFQNFKLGTPDKVAVA